MTPAQERTLEALRCRKGEVDPTGVSVVLSELRENLMLTVNDERVTLDAYGISTQLGCQAMPRAAFQWTANLAVKPVVVEAVKLWAVAQRPPLVLVEWAIESLSEDARGVGEWLQTASERELVELRAEAVVQVSQFLEIWPAMDAGWWPQAQVKSAAKVEGVVLRSKVDLAVGKADNRALVSICRGIGKPSDFEPLAHAALVETMRTGVVPKLMVAVRPELGQVEARPVTERDLEGAALRAVAATAEVVRHAKGGELNVIPGPQCNWCAMAHECAEGAAFLAEQEAYG